MTFDDSLHPRGQAGNAGQFRAKTNSAPSDTLTIEPSPSFAAADELFRTAEAQLRREAVREMIRQAPQRAAAIVFELYSEGDPDAEMLAFSHFADEDGEELDKPDRAITDLYYDLASRLDAHELSEYGFTRDREMFTLEVPQTDPAETARRLEDAITLHQYVTFNATRQRREETDKVVHAAAVNHIRALASKLRHSADHVIVASGDGVGLHLMRTESADGRHVHDHTTFAHPSHAADRPLLDEISFAASNIRTPALAGLTPIGNSTYRLLLNP